MTNPATIAESTFDDQRHKAFLSSGQVIHGFHDSNMCADGPCPVHKPTDHELRKYALKFNFDAFLFERIVPAVDGSEEFCIPDPDDYNLRLNNGLVIYRNSAICRFCKETLVVFRVYDEKTCSCAALTIKGGHKEMVRIGHRWIENSIIYQNGRFL